jgi:hypothetical protein
MANDQWPRSAMPARPARPSDFAVPAEALIATSSAIPHIASPDHLLNPYPFLQRSAESFNLRPAMDKQKRNTYNDMPQADTTSLSEETLDGLDEVVEQLLEENRDRPLQQRPSWQRRNASIAVVASIAAVSAIAGFILGTCTASATIQTAIPSLQTSTSHNNGSDHTHSGLKTVQIKDCGKTPHDAKSRGCVFDLMLQRWISSECFDEEHMERFLAKYPRKWYFDIELEHEMDDEIGKSYRSRHGNEVSSWAGPELTCDLAVVRKGEHQVSFTPSDYHKRHCSYTWELTTRALSQQKPLLDELISFEHTNHCNGIMLGPDWNRTQLDNGRPKPTEVDPGYLRCASYNVWLHDMPE